MKKAIFLDRDGTLIRDKGVISNQNQVELYPFAIDALRKMQKHFLLFIVTNQSGIADGKVKSKNVTDVNRYLVALLKKKGCRIQDVYCCPHNKADACKCRKPNPYFLKKAARDYNIDLRSSFVVGDHPSDAMLAVNAGASSVYVLTGHGKRHRRDLLFLNTKICKDLGFAARYIVSEHHHSIV